MKTQHYFFYCSPNSRLFDTVFPQNDDIHHYKGMACQTVIEQFFPDDFVPDPVPFTYGDNSKMVKPNAVMESPYSTEEVIQKLQHYLDSTERFEKEMKASEKRMIDDKQKGLL